jgi:hypothetical protein
MVKRAIISLVFSLIYVYSIAQPFDGVKCLMNDTIINLFNSSIPSSQAESTPFTKNGRHFTPKGEYRFLIIYVGFDDPCNPANPNYNMGG